MDANTAERRSRVHRLGDGRALGYAEYGDPEGAPVFALHGTPGSRLTFTIIDDVARARGLRVIAPDRPGCGLSDFKRFDALPEWTEDLASLADALGIDEFALIGVSGGGPYAVAAAAVMPERIAFIALVSPIGPVHSLEGKIVLSAAHRRVFRDLPSQPVVSATVFWSMRSLLGIAPGLAYRGLMQRAAPADRPILEREDVRRSLIEGHREGLARDVRGAVQDLRLFTGPWGIDIRNVDVPAVLWQGLQDRNVPPVASELLAEALPNCRLDVIPSAGHYWIFDHLDEVLDAVEALMKAGRDVA